MPELDFFVLSVYSKAFFAPPKIEGQVTMKFISLCAGIGVTDACFVASGAQPIVVNDINKESIEIHRYNHSTVNPAYVVGDLTQQDIQADIINKTKDKLDGNALDAMVVFLPPMKELSSLIDGLNHLAIELKPTFIFIDALQNRSYHCVANNHVESNKNMGSRIIPASLFNEYNITSKKHNLNKYNVPNESKREPIFMFSKNKFTDELFCQIEKIINEVDKKRQASRAPTIKEALRPIASIEPGDNELLPLHNHHVILEDNARFDFNNKQIIDKISALKAGESLFDNYTENKMINSRKKSYCTAKRHSGDEPFPYTLVQPIQQGIIHSIHHEKNRAYTIQEWYFIATMDRVALEINPKKIKAKPYNIISHIVNATAPAYINIVIEDILKVCFLRSLGAHEWSKIEPDRNDKRFNNFIYQDDIYYVGSFNGFMPIISNSLSLFNVNSNSQANNSKLCASRIKLYQELKSFLVTIKNVENHLPDAVSIEPSFYQLISCLQSMKEPRNYISKLELDEDKRNGQIQKEEGIIANLKQVILFLGKLTPDRADIRIKIVKEINKKVEVAMKKTKCLTYSVFIGETLSDLFLYGLVKDLPDGITQMLAPAASSVPADSVIVAEGSSSKDVDKTQQNKRRRVDISLYDSSNKVEALTNLRKQMRLDLPGEQLQDTLDKSCINHPPFKALQAVAGCEIPEAINPSLSSSPVRLFASIANESHRSEGWQGENAPVLFR